MSMNWRCVYNIPSGVDLNPGLITVRADKSPLYIYDYLYVNEWLGRYRNDIEKRWNASGNAYYNYRPPTTIEHSIVSHFVSGYSDMLTGAGWKGLWTDTLPSGVRIVEFDPTDYYNSATLALGELISPLPSISLATQSVATGDPLLQATPENMVADVAKFGGNYNIVHWSRRQINPDTATYQENQGQVIVKRTGEMPDLHQSDYAYQVQYTGALVRNAAVWHVSFVGSGPDVYKQFFITSMSQRIDPGGVLELLRYYGYVGTHVGNLLRVLGGWQYYPLAAPGEDA